MAQRTLRSMIETGEVCRCLRAKTLFYDVGEVPEPEDSHGGYVTYSGLNGPFWCSRTQAVQGPDSKFASIENCVAGCGRDCCETA
jgi:hypothetical protein